MALHCTPPTSGPQMAMAMTSTIDKRSLAGGGWTRLIASQAAWRGKMNTKMNVNLLRFLAFHQEDGRQAAGCEDGRGERMCLCVCMCVKVGGGGRGCFGIRGGGECGGTGCNGSGGSGGLWVPGHGHATLLRSGRRMSFSPPWQRHRVPPREGFDAPPNSLPPPFFSQVYLHRGCATHAERIPK